MRDFTILVGDDDPFESGYIGSMLQGAGATVAGPMGSIAELRAWLAASPAPGAVILGARLSGGAAAELVASLQSRKIACLLLMPPGAGQPLADPGVSILERPFGAYQVVEWAEYVAAAANR